MSDRPAISAPFSVRLSADERARLEREAAGMALGAYVRWRLLDPSSPPPPRSRGKFPVQDHAALSKLLALLGRVGSNLNQFTKAANSGLLDLTPETEAELRYALAEIADMRPLLVEALGLDGGR